jgi:oligopeptide transport system substrate-binding protein
MARRGEIDYTTLSADVVDAWLTDASTANMVSMERPAIDYSYFYCFNFNVYALDDSFYR